MMILHHFGLKSPAKKSDTYHVPFRRERVSVCVCGFCRGCSNGVQDHIDLLQGGSY